MNLTGSFLGIVVQFVIVLGLLLFFHEFGHFLTARLLHIEVEEFGFGFPPRLVKLFRIGSTDFTLNWIPFGAFVRPKAENDPSVPGGLGAAKPGVRLAVLLGGPAMNILVGLILFSVMFLRIGAPELNTVQVVDISANSPAAQANLKPGDILKSVNGQTIDSMDAVRNAVQNYLGKPVSLEVDRAGKTITVQLTPRAQPPQGQGPLGIVMGNPYKPITLAQAIPAAGLTAYDQ
ncbi:MAG TPA: M50 family metallopeptidase, partial [Anaerolineales bacterium]